MVFCLSKYEKVFRKLNNNKKDVLISELDCLLRHYGFSLQSQNATHKVYIHPDLPEQVTIVTNKNKVKLAVYVDKALSAIKKIMFN